MRCRRAAPVAVWVALALLAATARPAVAAPAFREHRGFDAARLAAIRKVGLLGLDVKVYELSAGAVREPKDEWTRTAAAHLRAAFGQALAARGVALLEVPDDPAAAEEVGEVRALYEVVGGTIVAFTYVQPIPGKLADFDYSVGDVSALLDRHGLDAFLFVTASDQISSGGRKTAAAVTALVGALVGVVAVPRGGQTTLAAALVDRSGAVLWFALGGGAGGYDLREAASAARLVEALLSDLPAPPK